MQTGANHMLSLCKPVVESSRASLPRCCRTKRGQTVVKQWSNSSQTVVESSSRPSDAGILHTWGGARRAAPGACQCRTMGAIVWPLPINFSRNNRNVRGRLGLHGLGGPGPKRVTWILYAAGLRCLPGHPCQVSILIPYHHPYLSYILIPSM